MNLPPNDWTRVREHYKFMNQRILSMASNEWAIDAYSWEDAGIRLTPIESWVWGDIRAENMVMYPQYPIGGVFVDFGNPVAKVAIECDGRDYHQDKAKDKDRDDHLAELGWTVYRLTGTECREDSDPDTGEPGTAGRLMKIISRNHKVKRGVNE